MGNKVPRVKGKLKLTAPTIIEDSYMSRGIFPISGVDEAGRGPLAGPVVAAAVILPPGLIIEGVNDSKKLNHNQREELALRIKTEALAYAYGIVDVEMIEEINILQAALLAMKTAVEGLQVVPQMVLVDGNRLPDLQSKALAIKKGDSASHLIAAASILAKTKRDEIMLQLHKKYPLYGFDKHKGYGTKAHQTAIIKHGLCPQHRAKFVRRIYNG